MTAATLGAHAGPHRDPAWRGRVAWLIVGLAIVLPLMHAAEFRPWLLFEADSLKAARRFIVNFFPPATSTAFLQTAAIATWQTIAIATAGMAIALVIAIPATCAMTRLVSVSAIGQPMAHGPRVVRVAMRWSMILLRSVPELVFALFFVRLFGLGPTAGVLAIGLSYAGMLAAVFGLLLSLPASMLGGSAAAIARCISRPLLAVLRAIPELVWAALFVIVAGLGPFSGTMALALHTTGVLGRLFAETIENLPPAPADALRAAGVCRATVFAYATLPQAAPQFLSYALYRWENNIRAAAILGVVGAGGLGQMLMFHLSLFRMQRVATIVVATIALVAVVDGLSALLRRSLTR